MQRPRRINKPLNILWHRHLYTGRMDTPPQLHANPFQYSEGKAFKRRQPRAAQHSWSPGSPPANSPAPEGQGGTPWGLSAWTLALDKCTGLAGPVFSVSVPLP